MERDILERNKAPNPMKKPTRQQRILVVLQSLQSDNYTIPEEYIRRHETGDGVSARYFKQVLLVSECNGCISELRSKGYDIEMSKEKDRYGFACHRLRPANAPMTRADHLKIAAEAIKMFNAQV